MADGLRTENELVIADKLREASGLNSRERLPDVGDIVEIVGKGLGICTEYRKGWCYVRALDDAGELTVDLDFVADEARHGKRDCEFIIRDDLR